MEDLVSLSFTVVLLVCVILVGWIAVRYLIGLGREKKGGAGNGGLRLLQSRVLGTRSRLLVVAYRDREYVLGVSGDEVRLIDRLPLEIAPDEEHGDAVPAAHRDPASELQGP